jgi:hypothetical protein
MGMKGTEAVPTVAPISDADSRARLVEERKNGLPCTLVADDGLYCGTSFEVRCTGPWACIEAGCCFWRRWHGIPAGKMQKCDGGLDD